MKICSIWYMICIVNFLKKKNDHVMAQWHHIDVPHGLVKVTTDINLFPDITSSNPNKLVLYIKGCNQIRQFHGTPTPNKDTKHGHWSTHYGKINTFRWWLSPAAIFLQQIKGSTIWKIDMYVINPWTQNTHFNTLRPRQNGRHFPDAVFRCIFLNENV